MLRSRWLWLGVLVAAIAVVVAATTLLTRGAAGRGHLAGLPGSNSEGFGLPNKHVGDYVMLGWWVQNNGDQPITLERVVPVQPGKGIALRRAFAVYKPDGLGDGDRHGYRVPPHSRPFPATLTPHARAEIELAVQQTRRGHPSWKTVQVVYSEGGHTHTLAQNVGVRVCAPALGNCPAPNS